MLKALFGYRDEFAALTGPVLYVTGNPEGKPLGNPGTLQPLQPYKDPGTSRLRRPDNSTGCQRLKVDVL